jgi:hypothetical protein
VHARRELLPFLDAEGRELSGSFGGHNHFSGFDVPVRVRLRRSVAANHRNGEQTYSHEPRS